MKEYRILWFYSDNPDLVYVHKPDAFFGDEDEALNEIAWAKKQNPYRTYILCKEIGRMENIVFERAKTPKNSLVIPLNKERSAVTEEI